jgi:Ser-tRNA(Ala) deacylase AlaX
VGLLTTTTIGGDNQPMKPHATQRLYLDDDHCFQTEAIVVAVSENSIAFDQSCFYPGGGGQPPDEGYVRLQSGEILEIASAHSDPDDIIWHLTKSAPPSDLVGQPVKMMLNRERRLALMRYHTVLHVLNTVALKDYRGWITGVQIGADYSRIDFKIEGFSSAMCSDLEQKVNAVLCENHAVRSHFIPEEEFRKRDDLLRTLEVKPPVSHGRVRVVEIQGFDAQACGGTHVSSTAEVGTFSIFRTENKGEINKRLYVRLNPDV